MSRTSIFFLLFLILVTVPVRAQDTPPAPTVADAIAARDSGNLAGAAALLRQVLEREPANGEATRHLAQLLYWLKDVPGATGLYEKGMQEHPEDYSLQLDYGRMLVETRRDARAIEILTPLTSRAETGPRASTLLGSLQYWSGDLTAAARLFRTALAADPSLAEARKQLDEIRGGASPWITLAAAGLHDDQPVDWVSGDVEAGLFITPLTSLHATVSGTGFRYEDEFVPCPDAEQGLTDATCRTSAVATAAYLSHTFARARIDTRFGGGVVYRSLEESTTDWTGRASLRFRPLPPLSLEVAAERAPYFSTEASLYVPVMTNSGTAKIALNHRSGWLGEAAFRLQEFDDSNKLRSIYAWGLAPLITQKQFSLSGGYSIASQDADESRFNIRYDPYYTPENILAHSALARVAITPSPRTMISASGSYGFAAREDAPILLPSIGGGVLTFERRDFNPWEARASIATALTSATSLSASVDAMKTAFYRATTARVSITHRFLPRPSL